MVSGYIRVSVAGQSSGVYKLPVILCCWSVREVALSPVTPYISVTMQWGVSIKLRACHFLFPASDSTLAPADISIESKQITFVVNVSITENLCSQGFKKQHQFESSSRN